MAKGHEPPRTSFRWRGGEITRLEGFSDAVFAFAVTLLIVSLEVPHTFTDLMVVMRGFIAFAICFTLLIAIWHQQYTFFRRYGLQDGWTIVLNSALLFVVLFYIYPLKFLFALLVDEIWGRSTLVRDSMGTIVPALEQWQFPTLMLVYDAGYIAVSLILALMFFHAWRMRAELELNPLEEFDTVASIAGAGVGVFVGCVSVALVLSGRRSLWAWAGWCYPILLFTLMTLHGSWAGSRRRLIWERAETIQPSE
jgi:hypothetical protein